MDLSEDDVLLAVRQVLQLARPGQPDDESRETPEQRTTRAVVTGAAHEALAARSAVEPRLPVHTQLPYFPYASSEVAECAICLEPLRRGQLCSEVPACRNAFHRDCLGAWVKSKGSYPLCRETIVVLGSDDVAVADDMV